MTAPKKQSSFTGWGKVVLWFQVQGGPLLKAPVWYSLDMTKAQRAVFLAEVASSLVSDYRESTGTKGMITQR